MALPGMEVTVPMNYPATRKREDLDVLGLPLARPVGPSGGIAGMHGRKDWEKKGEKNFDLGVQGPDTRFKGYASHRSIKQKEVCCKVGQSDRAERPAAQEYGNDIPQQLIDYQMASRMATNEARAIKEMRTRNTRSMLG